MIIDVIGDRAYRALVRAGGRTRVLARTATALWLDAAGDTVWLGTGRTPHPRAILARALPDGGDVIDVDVTGARVWRAPRIDLDAPRTATLRRGTAALRAELAAVGAADGLARLFVACAPATGMLADVLARAAPHVEKLAEAARTDRAADAVAPAIALLGLGPGLTPAGDDFVGGVMFGRQLLARAGVADAAAWRTTGAAVRQAARERTHPISAALLGDLIDGESHAALHELVQELAAGADPLDPARRLTRIGHSSGWDILAGVLSGLR